MTVRRSWTLICDGCESTMDDGTLGAETARETREFAKRDGGHVNLKRGRDICADCWEQGVR